MTEPQQHNLEKAIEQLIEQYFDTIEYHHSSGFLHAELIRRAEHALIQQVLKQTHDNQSHAATLLGISRTTLRKKMAEIESIAQ